MSDNYRIDKREVMTIFDALSKTGGLSSVLALVFKLISIVFRKTLRKMTLINDLYRINNDNSQQKTK
jgi:hypothetical protein